MAFDSFFPVRWLNEWWKWVSFELTDSAPILAKQRTYRSSYEKTAPKHIRLDR